MRALTVRGSYKGVSGHDRHIREFVHKLIEYGIQVKLLDFPNWSPNKLPFDKRDMLFDTLSKPVDSKVMLHFCMPHQVRVARQMLNVNFTMFEATRIPKDWVKHNSKHDLVILPTESSRLAWIESGFPEERIKLCPLGVEINSFNPDVKPLELFDDTGRKISEYRVRFLNISDVMPRKNLLGLLRVWIKATSRTDDTVLIIKLSCGSQRWLNKFMRSLEKMENMIGKTRKESAPIIFLINHFFSDLEMPKLYAAATHYWSMSHGEGWDLSMMEAGATGLNLIAPQHTAYTAYLDDSVANMLPVQRMPAKFKWSDGTHRFFEEADWWEPDEAAATEYIHKAMTEFNGKKNDAGRSRIAKDFTWKNSTRRLLEILEEADLLLDVPPQRSALHFYLSDRISLILGKGRALKDRIWSI